MVRTRGTSRRSERVRGASVALTGASGHLGRKLVHRLLADPTIEAVLALDLEPPPIEHPRLRFHPLDLTSGAAGRVVAQVLAEHHIDALGHLVVLASPHPPGYAHEVEAIGTMRVLAGLGQAQTRRLVLCSTTLVYGASPGNPNYLDESHPLHGCPRSRFVGDKVEMERQVAAFRAAQPDRTVTVLRFPPILGESAHNPFTRYLSSPLSPTVMGFDPLVQVVHTDDAVHALAVALTRDLPGAFNVASREVLPLSSLLRLAGAHPLPLPHPCASAALGLFNALGVANTPPSLLDYLRFLWVADVRRAEAAGLLGHHTAREAIESFARSRRRTSRAVPSPAPSPASASAAERHGA